MIPLSRTTGEVSGSPISNQRRAARPFCSIPWTANNLPSWKTKLELKSEDSGAVSMLTLVPSCVAGGGPGSGVTLIMRSEVSSDGFVGGPSIEVVLSWPNDVSCADMNGSDPDEPNATAGVSARSEEHTS